REFAKRNRHAAEAGAVGNPVRPSHGKPDDLAEGAPRVHVIAAGLGQHRAQLGKAGDADERIEAADDPDGEDRRAVGKLTGDEAGRPQDADADGAADDDGEAETHTEDPNQTGPGRWDGGRGSQPRMVGHRLASTNGPLPAFSARRARQRRRRRGFAPNGSSRSLRTPRRRASSG